MVAAAKRPHQEELSALDLTALASFARERLGLSLTNDRRLAIMSRLLPMLRQYELPTFTALNSALQADTTGELASELANRLTTNHTAFFREPEHFDLLQKKILPSVLRARERTGCRDLRVWSAGCASGEEAYTLAMVIAETLGVAQPEWLAGVLATDVSARAIAEARAGRYSDSRLRGVPPDIRQRYFTLSANDEWSVSDALKREVTFRRLNLVRQEWPFKQPFDVVFCRNVSIYFDPQTRAQLIHRLAAALVDGGYLFVGHAEVIERGTSVFERVYPAVYRKKAQSHA